MGLQSATVNILLSEPTSTTAMTGNVTRLVLEISDLVLRGGDGAKRQRVARMVVLVLGFGLGAVAGPIGLVTFGFGVLLMPIITLAAVGASRRPWA